MPSIASSPAEKIYLEDYRVGEVFTSQARTLTEPDVVHYSMFTGDWDRQVNDADQWVVPDMFTFSLGLCLLLGAGRYTWMAKSFIAFYGFDTIEVHRQVTVGDTIASKVTVMDLVERDEGRGVVVFRHETVDQQERLVCTSDHRALLARRPSEVA
jgi:3-hydroxybutyryl-CoA dehydratase